ncbi:MAG: hypothetical protein LBE91_01195 [Tannerella sp.]|nr:hypothetical protein [Tannerella sp.]
MIRGETGSEALVRSVYGNRKNRKSGRLKECLTGNMKAHQRLKLIACKRQFDLSENRIQLYLNEMQNFTKNILAKKSAI